MARGNKNIEGQLTFDFCIDKSNYVCQANTLVGGKQSLKLNSAKLIRAAIMQVVREDQELKPYVIRIHELAELFGISASNVYRDIDKITNDIISNPVFIKESVGKTQRWIKIPWVTRCEYSSDIGVYLKLNDELKPFLLNLRKNYTQYTLENILVMKSSYSIRIYEMLQERILSRSIPAEGTDIELTVQEIRECCGCENNHLSFSNFRSRVIDVAVKEINNQCYMNVSYGYRKNGRSVISIIFHISNIWGGNVPLEKRMEIEEKAREIRQKAALKQ